ncbi:MAG: carboxypeptidase regulatory-like domain-containing protein [Acidobacteriota bacterium]
MMTRENAARGVFLAPPSLLRRVLPAFLPSVGFLLIALFVTPFATNPAAAQSVGTGTITGTVTDNSQALITTASVLITDTDTGVNRTLPVNGAGIFVAPFLQPGHYTVRFSANGFATVEKAGLVLTVGQTLTVDATLPPASVSSQVLVTSEVALLDTQKTDISQNVGERIISNLPVNGRRWDNFVLLTPNVAPDGNSGLISYRGISGLYNSNQVDGVNNNQAFFSEARGRAIGSPYVYSQDSVQEFQSAVSGYSAEFGGAAGGQINAVTKSGSNILHGDLFYYLRYPSLNALDPYSKAQGLLNHNPLLLTQPVHQQQQFGGSAGGPIQKDKLFYFFTYDGFRKVNPIFYTSSVSASTLLGYANSTATCPAPLTAAQCTTAAQYLVSLQDAYPRTIKQDIFFPKLDYQLNDTNHLSAAFNWQNFHEPNGYNTSTQSNNGSVTQNGTADFHSRFLVATWSTALRPTIANEIRFQWSRDLETDGTNSPGPSVSITGLSAYGETSALPRAAFPDEHRIELEDILSTTFGKHSLRSGVDLNFIHEVLINLFQGDGGYTYSAGSAANSFANWVQDVYQVNGGKHYTFFSQVNDPITHVGKDDFWNPDLAGFSQDTWKLRNNLTLNLGLRYDIQLVPQPPRPNTTSALATYYTDTININHHEFQPRIGFSWAPRANMVVRGGYGLFYGLTSNSTYYTMRVENGVFQQQYNATPSTSWAPTAPNVLFQPPGPPLAAPFAGAVTPQVVNTGASLAALAFRGLDPHFTNPYSHSFDASLEQQLPGRMSVSIGWVGNRGMRLPVFIDTNIARTTTTKTYDIVSSAGSTSRTITVPFYTTRLTTADGSILSGFSVVNSWYNSMVFTFRRPFAHGLEIVANYTYAHSTDGGQVSGVNGTFNGTDTPLDPYNLKQEYGRSDLDMRERFVGSLVYAPDLSFIASRPFRYLANGWMLSGAATEQTGFPLTAFMANYPGGAPDGGVSGAAVSLFNSSTGGRAPQVPRNGFPGPGVRNIDARVTRDFPIHETIKFEILGEAFNLVNHQNILNVNTSAFSYAAPGAGVCTGHTNACIYPYPSQPFGATTGTSSTLYGARQLQVSAKLFF